jgi:hypothetical protein
MCDIPDPINDQKYLKTNKNNRHGTANHDNHAPIIHHANIYSRAQYSGSVVLAAKPRAG